MTAATFGVMAEFIGRYPIFGAALGAGNNNIF
jgi:hypothetical protein